MAIKMASSKVEKKTANAALRPLLCVGGPSACTMSAHGLIVAPTSFNMNT